MDSIWEEKIRETALAQYKQNVYLIGMHMLDATNILQTLQTLDESHRPDLLAKACILFAAAGLETNLSYYSILALALNDAAPAAIYQDAELEYLKALQMDLTKDAELSPRKQKQSLDDRLVIVPRLLGRAFERTFDLTLEDHGVTRLNNTIERRDVIIHPSCDRYPDFGLDEAVEAIYSVALYLDSVRKQFFPYMVGYIVMLSHHAPLISDLVKEEPVPLRFLTLREPKELIAALSTEWTDAHVLFDIANMHGAEGDSDGSMLTRTALVMLYAMVNAHLSIIAHLALESDPSRFPEKERNYFNEVDYEVSASGKAILQPVKQTFEDRANIIPTVIASRLCPNKLAFNRGDTWYQNTFKTFFNLRNGVMHSKFGEAVPRVSKAELLEAFKAVRSYCEHLSTAEGILRFYRVLLDNSPLQARGPENADFC